jgi:hypothetical protein
MGKELTTGWQRTSRTRSRKPWACQHVERHASSRGDTRLGSDSSSRTSIAAGGHGYHVGPTTSTWCSSRVMAPSGFLFGVKMTTRRRSRPRSTGVKKDLEGRIDACNVLERDGVFDRWAGLFKGLHYILSLTRPRATSLTADTSWRTPNAKHGAAGIKACQDTRLRHAVGISRADAQGIDTFNDHWWAGFRVGRPGQPERFYARGAPGASDERQDHSRPLARPVRCRSTLRPPAWDAERVAEFGA